MKKQILVSLSLLAIFACSKKPEEAPKANAEIVAQNPVAAPTNDGSIGPFSAADVTRIMNAQVINDATGQPIGPGDVSDPKITDKFNKAFQLSTMGQFSKLPEACGWDAKPFENMKDRIFKGNKLDASFDDFWNKGVLEYHQKIKNGYNYKTEGTYCTEEFHQSLLKKIEKIYGGGLGQMAD